MKVIQGSAKAALLVVLLGHLVACGGARRGDGDGETLAAKKADAPNVNGMLQMAPATAPSIPSAKAETDHNLQAKCYGGWLHSSKGHGGEDAFLLTVYKDGSYKVDSFTGGEERGGWIADNSQSDPGTLYLHEAERTDQVASEGSIISGCGEKTATLAFGAGSVFRGVGSYKLIKVSGDFNTETAKRGILWNPD